MAVIDTYFNAIPLFGMDCGQSSDAYLQRNNQPGFAESPNPLSLGDLNQSNEISMANAMNLDPYFSMYNHCPSSTPSGGYMNIGYTPTFQNFKGGSVFSPSSLACPIPVRKKHKRHEDSCECPLKKRRLSEAAEVNRRQVSEGLTSSASTTVTETSEVAGDRAIPCIDTPSSARVQTPHNEDMEESPCEAACKKIQDIESRLNLADEDIESETSTSYLPTLIISDLLQESLKKGFEESFTKKMVESMSRPSMEIVLWKPQPEFLIDKLQSVARCQNNETELCNDDHIRPANPFPSESQATIEDELCTSNPGIDIDLLWNMWSREEEEMEL
ncbi:coiled-coil domain-containing protein 117 [Pelobates fuscus]|uniref:coiled-coil domain-containing protein 117 n=1 Tax=Pelobates fuscus TaxID=191477 RepID=UPI002FE484FE